MGTRVPSAGSGTVVATYHSVRDTPTGAVDGANVTFALSHAPLNTPDSLMVFQNGLKLIKNVHYTYSGLTITFINPPLVGDTVEAFYAYIL